MGSRDAIAVFLVVGAASVLTTSGSLRSADYVVAFSVAANLVDHGSLRATPIPGFEAWAVSSGTDGEPYCRYGLGHSLLGVPARVLGWVVALTGLDPAPALDLALVRFDLPDDPLEAWSGFFAVQMNALVLGALAVVLLHLSRLLGGSRRASLLAALLGTLGSPLFFQASDFTAEPASALALSLCAVGLARIEREGATIFRALAVGLAAGSTVFLKVAHGVLLLPGSVALALAAQDGRGARRSAFLGFTVGAALPLALVASYNQARFGDPLETGYGAYALEFTNPFFEGLVGQMLSPGRGLLLHFPAAILGAVGIRSLWGRSRATACLAVGSLLVLWLLYAPWFAWDGGWTYGPRLLSPATALLSVSAVLVLGEARRISLLAWGLVAWSFVASALGFAVDYVDYHFYLWSQYRDASASVIRWSVWDAPLVAWWGFPLRRGLALVGAMRAGGPWPMLAWFGTAMTCLLLGVCLLLRAGSTRLGR